MVTKKKKITPRCVKPLFGLVHSMSFTPGNHCGQAENSAILEVL